MTSPLPAPASDPHIRAFLAMIDRASRADPAGPPAPLRRAAAEAVRASDIAAIAQFTATLHAAGRLVFWLFATALAAAVLTLAPAALAILAAAYLGYGATRVLLGPAARPAGQPGALRDAAVTSVVWAPMLVTGRIAIAQKNLLLAGRVAARRRAAEG